MSIAAVQQDIRETIFGSIADRQYRAEVIVEQDGIVAGANRLLAALIERGIQAQMCLADSAAVKAGECVLTILGRPKQIALAEEFVIGMLAKPSGIATAARRAVTFAGNEIRIVCGAWKKMPPEIKAIVREAVAAGGAAFRISDHPFLYLDKNFVRMLGGIVNTLRTVAPLQDKLKVIQLKGQYGDVTHEAMVAVENGADILMIDTGFLPDVESAHRALLSAGWRNKVQLAFAKGVRVEDIPNLRGRGIDILDIGVGIIDAPLLDMKLEVREGLHAT